MAEYVIGDVHGCLPELVELLDRIAFDAKRDKLTFVGDLVNRGGQSLEVLRLVHSLGKRADVVLGNHDLHLLAIWCGARVANGNPDFDAIFRADDAEMLKRWLLQRPLLKIRKKHRVAVVHAGLSPAWSIKRAKALSESVSQALVNNPEKVLGSMYGNRPMRWSTKLRGRRLRRVVINYMTRARMLDKKGGIAFGHKGSPAAAPAKQRPWFEVYDGDSHIVFGHWSALGLMQSKRCTGLDTGCVWGGALTALRLDDREVFQVAARPERCR